MEDGVAWYESEVFLDSASAKRRRLAFLAVDLRQHPKTRNLVIVAQSFDRGFLKLFFHA